jgi:hypothetical protein
MSAQCETIYRAEFRAGHDQTSHACRSLHESCTILFMKILLLTLSTYIAQSGKGETNYMGWDHTDRVQWSASWACGRAGSVEAHYLSPSCCLQYQLWCWQLASMMLPHFSSSFPQRRKRWGQSSPRASSSPPPRFGYAQAGLGPAAAGRCCTRPVPACLPAPHACAPSLVSWACSGQTWPPTPGGSDDS